MARKKQEEEQSSGGGWLATFGDLMNLLLCFFVLLFSMSTVDADKYQQLVTSMSESINIFSGGGSTIGEGAFVSSGTDQLVSVAEYFNEYENSGESTDQNTQDDQTDGDLSAESTEKSEEEYRAKLEKEQEDKAKQLYDAVTDQAEKSDIEDQLDVSIDKNNQYVQISLNGALLFESGDAEIKKSMKPLMSKVGDILKRYEGHMIKIEGHTDNIPISGKYSSNMLLSTARANTVFEYMKNVKKIKPKWMETSGRGEYDPIASNKTAKGRAQNRRVEIKIYTDK